MKINFRSYFLLLFICTNCASYESVKTVGKIGNSLADYKPINDDVVFLCYSMQRINHTNQFPCDTLEVRSRKLNAGIDTLVAYSNGLLLAIQENDFDLSDAIAGTVKAGNAAHWINVSDNQLAGLTGVAGGIQKLVVKGVKRRAIRHTINSVKESVDTVCIAMIEMVALQKQSFNNYAAGVNQRFVVDSVFRAQLAGKNANALASLNINSDVLFLSKKYVRDELAKLNQAEKAIKAFQAAHRILGKQSSKIGKKEDAKVIVQMITSIKDIYKGVENFKTPATSN